MHRADCFSLFSLAALAIFTAGCSKPSDNAAGPDVTRGARTAAKVRLHVTLPAVPKSAIPTGPAKKRYKIGITMLARDDEFYRQMEEAMVAEAGKLGVDLKVESADKDVRKQIDQVQDFIASHEDAIIMCPVDSQGVGAAVAAANNAKIPVFTADIASKNGKVVSHIASDNVEGGRLVGTYLANEILKGKGNVAILNFSTVTSVQDRVKGFKEALRKAPGIKIVADQDVEGSKRENAQPKTNDMITAHPEINAIFGINDNVALGAVAALKAVNRPDVSVVGFDAAQEAQTYIAAGSALKADAIQYPAVIGAAAIDAAVKHLNGESVPALLPIPTGLVNAASFSK